MPTVLQMNHENGGAERLQQGDDKKTMSNKSPPVLDVRVSSHSESYFQGILKDLLKDSKGPVLEYYDYG